MLQDAEMWSAIELVTPTKWEGIILECRTVNVTGPAAQEPQDLIVSVLEGVGRAFHRRRQALEGDTRPRRALAGTVKYGSVI